MDIHFVRAIVSVVMFVLFLGIIWWAYTGHNRQRFQEAAQLPFEDDDLAVPSAHGELK